MDWSGDLALLNESAQEYLMSKLLPYSDKNSEYQTINKSFNNLSNKHSLLSVFIDDSRTYHLNNLNSVAYNVDLNKISAELNGTVDAVYLNKKGQLGIVQSYNEPPPEEEIYQFARKCESLPFSGQHVQNFVSPLTYSREIGKTIVIGYSLSKEDFAENEIKNAFFNTQIEPGSIGAAILNQLKPQEEVLPFIDKPHQVKRYIGSLPTYISIDDAFKTDFDNYSFVRISAVKCSRNEDLEPYLIEEHPESNPAFEEKFKNGELIQKNLLFINWDPRTNHPIAKEAKKMITDLAGSEEVDIYACSFFTPYFEDTLPNIQYASGHKDNILRERVATADMASKWMNSDEKTMCQFVNELKDFVNNREKAIAPGTEFEFKGEKIIVV